MEGNTLTNVINLSNRQKGTTRLYSILTELQGELDSKKDITVHPQDLRMNSQGLIVSRDKTVHHHTTDWALGQLASRLNTGLPIRYLRKCPPELQAVNVNHWISQFDYDKDAPWLLRTRTGQNNGIIRGVLSERYSPFDDHEIIEILTQFFGDSQADVDINWWYRDDTGFHLRILFNDLTTSVGKLDNGQPDIHKVGLHIENSEVGKKSIRITPLVWRLICDNGMMGWAVDGDIFKQRHLYLKPHEMYGRVAEAIGNALKVGDGAIEQLLQAKETPVEDPLDVIKQLAEKNKYSKEFIEKAQGKFMIEEGNTAFHVIQAFTRACQETDNPDFRTEVETHTTKMLEQLIS